MIKTNWDINGYGGVLGYTTLHHYLIKPLFLFKIVMSKITYGKNSYFIDKMSKITYNENS